MSRTRVSRVLRLLKAAIADAVRAGHPRRAARERKARRDLVPVEQHVDPTPPKPPKPEGAAGTPHVFEAIAAAKLQSATGVPHHGAGECLMAVRECYRFPAVEPDAIGSWRSAAHKHSTSDPHRIPRGVPVYWSGGSEGHGHIAISNGDGTCWSTDILRVGRFDRVPIAQIAEQWGLHLLGWAEEVNRLRVPEIGTAS